MKNISVSALAFSFIGSFLGAGYISGQELFQFFGAFGLLGVLGLFIAIAILSVFNLMIISIVNKNADAQIDKIKTASGNIAIIQSILNGYRKLVVFADDSNPEKITEHILTAVNALNQQYGKKIKLDITSFVEPKNAYGNNIVTIMLLPLVHNAYEASPANETINVSCQDKSSHFLLRVENLCDHKVNVENLAKDGFTTKEKGGEGLRSVRRISESLHFDFSIKTYESGRKVVATLKIPKSQEVTVDDK